MSAALALMAACWIASLALLAGSILALERGWRRERADLLTRIQAGSLDAYLEATAPRLEPGDAAAHPVREAVLRAQRAAIEADIGGFGGEG